MYQHAKRQLEVFTLGMCDYATTASAREKQSG
jgi:hypothetical protein